MSAGHILSWLRFEPFVEGLHPEERRATHYPEWAIIPNPLPDGSRNPAWLQAKHCAQVVGKGFTVVEISSL